MHLFPKHPPTSITCQLDCIRCNHKFPIAEDNPSLNGSRSDKWRALTQTHPDEHRRTIYSTENPTAHQEIYRFENEPGHERHHKSTESTPFYCPRCGADNRNWLYLQNKADKNQWKRDKQSLMLKGAVFFTLLFLVVVFIYTATAEDRPLQLSYTGIAIFIAAMILAASMPFLTVSSQWKSLREHKYLQHIPTQSLHKTLSPPVQTTLSLFVVLLIFLPIITYFLGPIAPEKVTLDIVDFFKEWFKFVGLMTFVSLLLANIDVNGSERNYDAHLPHPIYENTSDMTRVARWEVNKALKTQEITRKVQWMDVQRNSIGGLFLTGLLRGLPETADAEKVRAQKFTVQTDKWCRIVEANIADVLTARPATGSSAQWESSYKPGRTPRTHIQISA